ncbi:hypothetical protein METH_02225 [Leisingera methylohalidivorans DSM 14336]|uniref:Uncharacterized protein n=1 Tax=Leisingera methylohalidivorans DSM 14336 TaxID=999552 RepID=V9W101_9RHOB|nr:hypothetical protein METH_02225 [Leisingera methylohalidivorans DSM 14336]
MPDRLFMLQEGSAEQLNLRQPGAARTAYAGTGPAAVTAENLQSARWRRKGDTLGMSFGSPV